MENLAFESLILQSAEKKAQDGLVQDAWLNLRSLGLDTFGEFMWSMPNSEFPYLSNLLPKMQSEEVQKSWTGYSGVTLLNQTTAFVRYCATMNNFQSGHVESPKVLDYGCGYGRVSRLMLKYIEVENLFGSDPWGLSIELAREAGFGKNFIQTEEVPNKLPFMERSFQLIWAFSVFTHTTPEVTFLSLKTLEKYLKPSGKLIITLRPIEYWDLREDLALEVKQKLKHNHVINGLAFLSDQRITNRNGIDTYGDSSISLKELESNLYGLKIKDVDRSNLDPFQIYVTLGL